MTFTQLEYVIALDKYRQFVAAAEHCNITQPTLTMQLKKLEEEIGFTLFDRKKSPVEPTPSGELFIQKARDILQELNTLQAWIQSGKKELEGHFRIGIIPTLAPYLLPRFVDRFVQAHPESSLEFEEIPTDQIIHKLKAGELDLGIMATPLEEANLKEYPIFYEPFWAYLPERHPLQKKKEISITDLKGNELLLLRQGHCFRNQVLNFCQLKAEEGTMNARFHYESGSIETLKKLVQKNMGYTLVPELSLDMQIDKQFIKPLENPIPTREVSLVTHQSYFRHGFIDTMQKAIREQLPSHLQQAKHKTLVRWR